MNTNHIVVPNTGQQLYSGTILIISRFPNIRWVLQYGWYTYNNQKSTGWYLSSIPGGTILPVTESDLNCAIVVQANSSQMCPVPPHPHPHPGPQPPTPGPTPSTMQEMLDRAMITVDTIAQRNSLNNQFLPNGKMVRVNDVDGEVRYYEWSDALLDWIDISGLSSPEWGLLE